jgi:ABC-type Fe3+/spermidine/putrescine transport system ATPase subunit
MSPRPVPAGGAVDIAACGHAYGAVEVLRNIDLNIATGELVSLLGKSGSGKTTLLRIIAGLVLPSRGSIRIDGQDVTELPAEKRDIGVVFQNYALFPHLSVFENTAFPLRVRGIGGGAIRARVQEVLELVGLRGLADRFPAQLSGGQQQRVAIARAIVFRPRLLLMDEPLGSLDLRLRQQLQAELRRLQKDVGITTIYVTHDQDEAFAISDRIAVMDRGEILQIGTPSAVYHAPANRLVADFVGELNAFDGTIQADGHGRVLRTDRGLDIPLGGLAGATGLAVGARAACGLRPERVTVGPQAGGNAYIARLQALLFKGRRHWVEATLPGGDRLVFEVPETTPLREGDEVSVGWSPLDMHLFAADGSLAVPTAMAPRLVPAS